MRRTDWAEKRRSAQEKKRERARERKKGTWLASTDSATANDACTRVIKMNFIPCVHSALLAILLFPRCVASRSCRVLLSDKEIGHAFLISGKQDYCPNNDRCHRHLISRERLNVWLFCATGICRLAQRERRRERKFLRRIETEKTYVLVHNSIILFKHQPLPK